MAQKEKIIIKSKEVFYRGKKIEELKELDVREFAKYLTTTPRRYVLRNFDVIEKFLKRCEKKSAKKKKIKTHLREIVIVPKMVGSTIYVYNGKSYIDVLITAEMLGHRLGEFSLTRSRVHHGSAGIGATKSSRALKK